MNLTDLDPMVKGAMLSAVIAVALLFIAVLTGRSAAGSAKKGMGNWGLPAALTASFCAVFIWLVAHPHWPPAARWHWIFFIVLISGTTAIILSLVKRPRWLVHLAAPVSALIVTLLLQPPVPPGAENMIWLLKGAAGVAVLAFWIIMEPLANRRSGWRLPGGLMLCTGTAAYVILLSGNAHFAKLTGTAASVLGVALLLGVWRRDLSMGRGGVLMVGVILLGMLALGRLYTEGDLPIWCFVLPATAPFLLWVGELPYFRRRTGLGEAARFTACILPLIIAVLLARRYVPDIDLYDF